MNFILFNFIYHPISMAMPKANNDHLFLGTEDLSIAVFYELLQEHYISHLILYHSWTKNIQQAEF